MYEDKDKAIREANERERAENWITQLNFRVIFLILVILTLGALAYAFWRN